jgi:hypothetical protein
VTPSNLISFGGLPRPLLDCLIGRLLDEHCDADSIAEGVTDGEQLLMQSEELGNNPGKYWTLLLSFLVLD